MPPTVGILALQGDYEAHEKVFAALGAETRLVRKPAALEGLDALVLPGGESSAMLKLLDTGGMKEPLGAALKNGLPTFSTCAGVILLAKHVGPDQFSYGLLDVDVARNAWGRQVASFEVDAPVTGLDGDPLRLVFIRAPKLTRTGQGVEVLATVNGEPVLVRQGHHLAMAFHPEITGDDRLQAMFLEGLE